MNAQNADGSGITLADFAGLMKDMIDKLLGKNGRRWLNWLKRFLRKENPWPPMRNLFGFTTGKSPASAEFLLKALEEAGLSVPDISRFIDHPNFKPKPWESENKNGSRPEFSVLGIRVSDLLSPGQRVNFMYPDILKKAEEDGLVPCDVLNGLVGVIALIADQTQTHENKPLPFVICSEPFEEQGRLVKRLFTGIIWPGKKDNQGSIALQTIDHEEYSLRFQSDPNCLMIFMSMIE